MMNFDFRFNATFVRRADRVIVELTSAKTGDWYGSHRVDLLPGQDAYEVARKVAVREAENKCGTLDQFSEVQHYEASTGHVGRSTGSPGAAYETLSGLSVVTDCASGVVGVDDCGGLDRGCTRG